MNNPLNKQKVAIVTVGYNRLNSIKRLLQSLTEAHYEVDDVPLVISIDASGDEELYACVRNYEWVHGQKYVIIHETRLGLKEHIFSCGDLTKYFKGIILLEDDLYVSPYFYSYTTKTLEFYKDDPQAGMIGLYSYCSNIFSALPFNPYQGLYDVFALQSTITWGECWNERMWSEFRIWLSNNQEIDWDSLDIAPNIKKFKRAWSKFFTAFMYSTGKYAVAPYKSYTTNFSESGEHNSQSAPLLQVPLVYREEKLELAPVNKLVTYDTYFCPLDIKNNLLVPDDEVYIDFYDNRPNTLKKRYLLTVDILPFECVKTYGLYLKPIDANIRQDIKGSGIYLYDLERPISGKTDIQPISVIQYHLALFRPSLLFKYIKKYLVKKIIPW